MKKLLCPKCKINRFRVKNAKGDSVVVTVNDNMKIEPVHSEESLEDFNLNELFCLGCSWSGSAKSLSDKY